MVETADRLKAAAEAVQAYGLAAVHLGYLEPIIVMRNDGSRVDAGYSVYFNPAVELLSDERVLGAEGSVSMPGLEVQIGRSPVVELTFDDVEGTRLSVRLEHLQARIAQHEVDQVEGVFFLDRLSRLKRETAMRKWKKLGSRQIGR